MKTVVLTFVLLCAATVLSLAEDHKKSKPSVTMSPMELHGNSNVTNTTAATKAPTATTSTTTGAAKPTTATASTTIATTRMTTGAAKPTTATANTTTATTRTTTGAAKPTTATANATTATTSTTTGAAKPTTAMANTTTATTRTTTAAASTTTVKPTGPPTPSPSTTLTVGHYNVTSDKDTICLIAQMALQIRPSNTQTNRTFIVNPDNTKAQGGCNETTANLTLVFPEGHITFLFNKSAADSVVYVDALSLLVSLGLSNSEYTASNISLQLFTAKVGHSYSCTKESIYIGNGLYLDVSQDRLQAFNLTQSNEFGPPDVCAADQPEYRVAVAVGITLLVLVIIVVGVYLLSRRRRTDGYQAL